LLLAPKPLDVDVPPPFVLRREQPKQRAAIHVSLKYPRPRGFPQQGDDGIAPHRHQRLPVQSGGSVPACSVLTQAAVGDQDVQMAVEVQVTPEGVGDHNNQQPDSVFLSRPLLQDLGAQDRKIVEEMPVLLEERPKAVRHGQGDVGVRNLGKLPPLVALPGARGLMSAARTGA
jgi:hypothetical protein